MTRRYNLEKDSPEILNFPREILFSEDPPSPLITYGGYLRCRNEEIPENLSVDLKTLNPDLQEQVQKAKIQNLSYHLLEIWEVIQIFEREWASLYLSEDIELLKLWKKKPKITDSSPELAILSYSDALIFSEAEALLKIFQNLEKILKNQKEGSSLVIQMFSITTRPTVQMISWLASHYQEAFFVKSDVAPLSQSVYLCLQDRLPPKIEMKISIPKKRFISDLFLPIDPGISRSLQKYNGEEIPRFCTAISHNR